MRPIAVAIVFAAALAIPSASAVTRSSTGADCDTMLACADVVCEPRTLAWCGFYVCVIGFAIVYGWGPVFGPPDPPILGVLYPGCPF